MDEEAEDGEEEDEEGMHFVSTSEEFSPEKQR